MDAFLRFFDAVFGSLFGAAQSFNYLEVFDYLHKPFYVLFWVFFKNGGFLLFCWALMWCIYQYYTDAIIGQFFSKARKIFLSVNIPKNNEQTPKSIEALFTQIVASNSPANFKERYFDGKRNDTFSFEIISLGGYIQFILGIPSNYKDLIESSIFAQYPDAEIMEVPDYTNNLPKTYPDEEYNMWGCELRSLGEVKAEIKGVKLDCLPIKTYSDFIDKDAEEDSFKDPLAAVLEFMSKLNPGENVFIQILTRALDPVDKINPWREACRDVIKKIAGMEDDKKEKKKNPLLKIFSPFITIIKDFFSMLLTNEISKDGAEEKKEKKDQTNWATRLLPSQKTLIDNIEKKISKQPIECKIRMMYIAKKTIFAKGKAMGGLFGTWGQFSNPLGMSLIPSKETAASIDYFFINSRKIARQNSLTKGYNARNMTRGKEKYYVNTEELASMFHFPSSITVKTPLLTKVESKKVEPPMDLPTVE